MVGPQEQRATEEVDPELPESFHHSHQLLASGEVINFSIAMSLAEIRHHPFLSALQLRHDSGNRKIGSVNIKDNIPSSMGSASTGAETRRSPSSKKDRLHSVDHRNRCPLGVKR